MLSTSIHYAAFVVQLQGSAFGGGSSETIIHPVVGIAIVIAIPIILFLTRKYALATFLLVVFLSPTGQEVYVAGVHLFVLRILILAGCARMVLTKFSSRDEIFTGGIN